MKRVKPFYQFYSFEAIKLILMAIAFFPNINFKDNTVLWPYEYELPVQTIHETDIHTYMEILHSIFISKL